MRTLTESQRQTFDNSMTHAPSPRARTRAQSMLLSSRRVTIQAIVKLYEVERETVSSWIKTWEHLGVERL